jgi:colicin import membrane protein
MRSVQLVFIALGLVISAQVQAVPQSERVAFCEDQSQIKFPSRYEIQKAYNQCMENADKLIQAYEQDKLRRAEQDRIKRENLDKKLKERAAQMKQKQSESTDAGPVQEVSESYIGRVRARIKPNIVFAGSVEANASAEVEIRCAADGSIASRKLVSSSGNSDWDSAVLKAVDKTEILPRDVDGRIPSTISVAFRHKD